MIYSKLIHWIKVLYHDYSLKLPKVSYSFFFFFAKIFTCKCARLLVIDYKVMLVVSPDEN